MKKENELKELLDRLKGEINLPPVRAEPAQKEVRAVRGARASVPRPPDTAGSSRPETQTHSCAEALRRESARPPAAAGLVWSENKETMLFGMLASLAAMLGGMLGGVEYVTLAGAVAFMLFSFVMALTLFGYYLNFRALNSAEGALESKVEQLSRRLESLAARNPAGAPYASAPAPARDKELEGKVEELRMLVRSLAKAVEGSGE